MSTKALNLIRKLLGYTIVRFALSGFGVWLIGQIEVVVLVEVLAVNELVAYIGSTAHNVTLNFVLSDTFVFNHLRKPGFGKLAVRWFKFQPLKLGTSVINVLLFGVLVAIGIHYILASTISVGVIMVLNGLASRYLVYNEV